MSLVEALINSGSAENHKEAAELVADMRADVMNGSNPEDVLSDYGLEPDYVFDLLN